MPPRAATPRDGGRYVALLRGINVGRAKRVPMADLRKAVEALGHTDVGTLLNSGNVVFTAGAPVHDAAAAIRAGVLARTGVDSRVTVLAAPDVARIVAENPLRGVADNPSRLFVCVLTDLAVRDRLVPLAERDWGRERLAVGSRAAYLWCPDGSLGSVLPDAVARVVGDAATTRNWATMVKLRALAGG